MKSIPIVLAFTPNYLIPAVTTIFSILKNSKSTDSYEVICLLTEDFQDDVKKILNDWNSDRLTFKFLNLSDKLSGVYIDERYTAAATYRLLLPDILPSYSSIVYLDCDIIVRSNIADLYRNTNLQDYYLAAVYEATLSFQIPYVESIDCVPGQYFNSGFLIMNLEEMRKDNISPKLIEKANNPNSSFPDQDALNIVCQGKVLPLKPIYNSIRTYFLPQYKSEFLKYYSSTDWHDVQEHGNIHYTGAKPWNSYTVQFDVWWDYYEKLPRSIKAFGMTNKKLLFVAKMKRNTIVNNCFKVIQHLYRKYKS